MLSKITFPVQDSEAYALFRQVMPSILSVAQNAADWFNEHANLFLLTLRRLNLFTRREVQYLLDIPGLRCVKFGTGIIPSMLLLNKVEEYFKIQQNQEVPESFYKKLSGLSEMEAYVLCRWIRILVQDSNKEREPYELLDGELLLLTPDFLAGT